jgi:hypothetical protein
MSPLVFKILNNTEFGEKDRVIKTTTESEKKVMVKGTVRKAVLGISSFSAIRQNAVTIKIGLENFSALVNAG